MLKTEIARLSDVGNTAYIYMMPSTMNRIHILHNVANAKHIIYRCKQWNLHAPAHKPIKAMLGYYRLHI